jgi:hypothetical protein
MEAVGLVAWCTGWKGDEGGSVEMDGVLTRICRKYLRSVGSSDEDLFEKHWMHR